MSYVVRCLLCVIMCRLSFVVCGVWCVVCCLLLAVRMSVCVFIVCYLELVFRCFGVCRIDVSSLVVVGCALFIVGCLLYECCDCCLLPC